MRDVPRSTAIDPFTLTLPSIGPATPRSDGRPHAGDEFGQHHITHAPVTALAKPIEGLSCSVLARFSCGMATRVAPSTLSSAGRARRTGALTEVDAPGPWRTLAQVTHLAEARSLAQGGPSEETHWVLGPEPVRAGDWATARLADAGSRAHRQLPIPRRSPSQQEEPCSRDCGVAYRCSCRSPISLALKSDAAQRIEPAVLRVSTLYRPRATPTSSRASSRCI